MQNTSLSINLIRTDGGTQVRHQECSEAVQRYAEALTEKRELPRIDVFYDGTDYWLADGHHRLAAYKKRGHDTIPCVVHEGDRNAAVLFACLSNREHGLPLTSKDKRKIVLTYFKIPGNEKLSNLAVSKVLKLSVPFIKTVREEAGVKPSPSAHVGNGSKKNLNGLEQNRNLCGAIGTGNVATNGSGELPTNSVNDLNNSLEFRDDKNLNGLNNRPEESIQSPVLVTLPPGNKTAFVAELLRHFDPAYLRSCAEHLDEILPV